MVHSGSEFLLKTGKLKAEKIPPPIRQEPFFYYLLEAQNS